MIVAAAVIFLPMLLDGPAGERGTTRALEIPPRPDASFESRLLPVNPEDGSSEIEVDEPPVVRHPPPSEADLRGLETDVDEMTGNSSAGDTQLAQPSEPVSTPPPTEQPVTATPAVVTETDQSDSTPTRVPDPQLSGWVVQVGWFSGQENAQNLRDRLRGAGFTAFMEQDVIGGKRGYRVRVGPELERADANALRERLKESLGVEGIVMAHP